MLVRAAEIVFIVMDAVQLWAVKIKHFLVMTIMSHLLSLVSKSAGDYM